MFRTVISHISKLFREGLRLVKFALGFMIMASIVFLTTITVVYFHFAKDLPAIESLSDYKPPVISEVFADDGTKIGEFWTECRIFLPYDKMPKKVIEAFVDSEDARFFEHKGVDARSILRAFIANIKAGEITQGGSTITQQVTRSLLLSRERKLARKIKEAILATRIERYLTKEQILTIYLNQIFLGNRAYGVAAAARNYFHKDISELSTGQIAIIAALPSAPSSFSPLNNPKEARRRQMHVLNRMVEEDHITEAEAAVVAEERFEIYAADVDKSFNDDDAAYFIEHVRRIVKEEYGDEFLYNKGLKIYTTVNMPTQRAATRAIRRGVEDMDRRQGWRGPLDHVPEDKIAERSDQIERQIIVRQYGEVIDWPPEDGNQKNRQIRFVPGKAYEAIVTTFRDNKAYIKIGKVTGTIDHQGFKWAKPFSNGWLGSEEGDYVKDPQQVLKIGDVILAVRNADGTFTLAQKPEIQGALMAMDPHTGFIKAMVGGYDFNDSEFNRATQALRQPGSSFKPFVYSAALDKGYTYDTVILDSPIVYQVGRNSFWSPKNYDGKHKGSTPFRNALMFSRNIPTVKITFDIGTHYLTAYARKLGLTTPIEKYLSMALGSNAVYLKDMVQAYSVFADMGKMRPAVAITKIMDVNGQVLQSLEIGKQKIVKAPAEAKKKDVENAGDEKSPEMIIQESDLNPALFREGLETIEKDSLVLTDLEIKTLYGEQIPPDHVITPQTAYLMTTLLKSAVEGGTGTRVKALGKPAAGKTGTTNDETDVWFIGFVPDFLAGVWIGFDELKSIGKRVAGGNTAAPIFLDFMKEATKDFEAKDFERPPDFPQGEISSLAGGSALFGARPTQDLSAEGGGADRAGRFFEEDMEELEYEVPEDDENM